MVLFSRLDRSVLAYVAKPLLGALVVGLVILFAERLVMLLDLTLGKQNSFSLVLELLAYWFPHYAALAAPLALYFGMIVGFRRMVITCEIEAWMAAGVTIHRLARPVLFLSVFLSGFALLMLGWVQPHAYYAYQSIIYALKHIDAFYLAEEGIFIKVDHRTFVLDKLNRRSSTFEGVFLFEDQGEKGVNILTAEKGRLVRTPGQDRPTLRLEHAMRVVLSPSLEKTLVGDPVKAQVMRSQYIETPLGRLDQWVFRARGHNVRERTLGELLSPPKNASDLQEQHMMTSEFHKRLVSAAMVLILPFLAIPFSLGSRRQPQVWKFICAGALVVGFYEMLEQGALLTRASGASPFFTLWLPFLVMLCFSLWRYWEVCFTMRQNGFDRLIEWGIEKGRSLMGLFYRRSTQ